MPVIQVIPGMEAAVKSMRVGGIRRVIIPPSQGYQNTSQEPIPPNVSFVLQTSSEKKRFCAIKNSRLVILHYSCSAEVSTI